MGKRSRRILTALGIVIVALGIAYAGLMVRATVKLRRAYAALEADGRPMRTADIMPPKVPDSENAAVLYQSAILMLKGQPAGEKSLFESLTAHADAVRKEAEKKWLGHEVVTNALSLIEQGTRRPACQIEHNNDNVLDLLDTPFLDDLRRLGSIMMARANYEAQAGNPAAAWELVLTQLRFADSLRSDPSSDTQFARLGLALRASRMMRQLCETAPPEPEHCRAISDLLKRQEGIDPLIRAIDGERLLIGEWFFNLPRGELDRILWKEHSGEDVIPVAILKAIHRAWFTVVAFRPRFVADHAAYLQVMRKRVQVLQGPYRDRKEIDQFMQMSHWNFLTSLLTGWGGNDKWYYCRFSGDLKVTRAGLALLQYKQAHGTFPETLDALGLEGMIDPYTDKPLLYRVQSEGFAVYSVGEDLKDNGGIQQRRRTDSDPRRKPIEYDQVWLFPDPELQPVVKADEG
ncbi:MAG: hypothetical protein ABFE13_23680 [Phycisphaerales bacterium]